MSINNYLSNLASSLVLSDNEKSSINISISALESKLNIYFGSEIIDKFKFGSSTRGTILPRKVDSDSDIDYMIIFNNTSNLAPQTYLNKLKIFAEKYYSLSEIHQSSPTIVLELNHIKFELVPAYKSMFGYYIPDGKGGWMNTNPNDINNELIEANKQNNSQIKPIIRLMKYWNINIASRYYDSYTLERKMISELKYAYFSCSSYTDYIIKAFEILKKEFYFPSTISNKIDKAIETIKTSVKEENLYPITSLDNIKKIFPEI